MNDTPATAEQALLSDRFGATLSRSLGLLSAVSIFFLMLLTCVDVFGRYVLNSPVPGAAEMVEQLMGVLIFTALPAVTLRRSHITIDLLDPVTPKAVAPFRDALIHLACAGFLGAVAWRLWFHAGSKIAYGDVTEYLNIPLYPIAYLMSALTAVTCALLVAAVAWELKRFHNGARPR